MAIEAIGGDVEFATSETLKVRTSFRTDYGSVIRKHIGEIYDPLEMLASLLCPKPLRRLNGLTVKLLVAFSAYSSPPGKALRRIEHSRFF
jgi:hypothetical protein